MVVSMIKARIGAEAPDPGAPDPKDSNPQDPSPQDRRQSPRKPIELEVTVRELGASGVEARVLNISEHGFMAESDARFEVGARVWLMMPGRERANVIIKWTAGDRLGAQFAEPISPRDLPQ
jgi:hypothetical protein